MSNRPLLQVCSRLLNSKDYFAKHHVFSIWSEINSNTERFSNQLYAPSEQPAIISPSTLSKNIKYVVCPSWLRVSLLDSISGVGRLWKGYFCRWDPTVVPPVAAFQYY